MGASRRRNDGSRSSAPGRPPAQLATSWVCIAHALAASLPACEPKLVVGKWSCSGADSGEGGEGNAEAERARSPVSLPWSTGFENGFCDYRASQGYCFAEKRATFETVGSPVHSGSSAAAFSVNTGPPFDDGETRCVRQGTLPTAAYYSAFYFIPSAPLDFVGWKLMQFRGSGPQPFHWLWDVSLSRDGRGTLAVSVTDSLRNRTLATASLPSVPIGSWFQIEVYLKRAADATGEFAVYQDGQLGLRLKDLVTDDSVRGRWYVGSLTDSLTPPTITVYVDDVAIREAP